GLNRIELGIPIKKIPPTLVQVVWRERSAVLLERMGRGLRRSEARVHPAFMRQPTALQQIAGRAGSDDIVPGRPPAARARHDMVEGEVVRGKGLAAILAGEAVAQED